MDVTVADIMNLDLFRSLRLLAGEGGLGKRVDKVGILDFEFTRLGSRQCVEDQWVAHELVLATFLYARDNPNQITDAVKKLDSCNTAGLAIKNVFSVEIPREAIRYANAHNFPLFLFLDNSVFFEDMIVVVSECLKAATDEIEIERRLHAIINGNHDRNAIKQMALEINHAFQNSFFTAYFSLKADANPGHLSSLFTRVSQKNLLPISCALLKYNRGFFFVHSTKDSQSIDVESALRMLVANYHIRVEDYFIGISDPHYYLMSFKKALLQSCQAAEHSRILDQNVSHYRSLGAYRLLLPAVDEDWLEDYVSTYVAPIVEFDSQNRANLLETVLAYEACQGNVKEIAAAIGAHENTARYRLAKIRELLQHTGIANINEELPLIAKIYRIKNSAGPGGKSPRNQIED